MSRWKLRSPDKFPPEFNLTVRKAYIECLSSPDGVSARHTIASGLERSRARQLADKFRCYRWCLRQYTGHALHEVEVRNEILTRLQSDGNVYWIELWVRKPIDLDPLERALIA